MGPVDHALEVLGLSRHAGAIVGGFSAAIALARATDMVATVPDIHTRSLADGMHRFPLPLSLREFTISLFWHPRMDADPAHRWLRTCVREVCNPTAPRRR